MHKIIEMLTNELYEYEEKAKKMSGGKISMQELEKIHKLSDTIKNLYKIEMLEDGEGYSGDTDFMGEGRMYGVSYARGRGRNAKRDSMGRYSREGGSSYDDGMNQNGNSYARMGNRGGRGGNRSYRDGYSRDGAKEHLVDKLEEMLEMTENHQERQVIEQCIEKLENA